MKIFFSSENRTLRQAHDSHKSFKQYPLWHIITNPTNIRYRRILLSYSLRRIMKLRVFRQLLQTAKCYLFCRMCTCPLVTYTHSHMDAHIHTQECQRNYNGIPLCCKTYYRGGEMRDRESERKRGGVCVCVEGVP